MRCKHDGFFCVCCYKNNICRSNLLIKTIYICGFKIKIFHSRAFPWGEVVKALLYRNFRVSLTRHKADIFIEASY